MTTQISDRLIFDGVEYAIKPFPLNCLNEDWLTRNVDGQRQNRFAFSSTALHRRYVAQWLLEGDKLYLVQFSAKGVDGKTVGIQDVFGVEKMLAFWFTGVLKSPLGERIEGLYEPVYEKDCVWEIEQGQLMKIYVHENNVSMKEATRGDTSSAGQSSNAVLPLMLVLDNAKESGKLGDLSDYKRDEFQKKLMTVIETVTQIKDGLILNYDTANDLEYKSMLTAWQHLTNQV